ncbi:hypothetical protein [Kitasatospora sp. GP82]|uniref:hypothetical protein n=1 Tax=Kitasatospora sp. GP82 TaxID=3035089 RepID=UPI002475B3A3|nr:hypothetical protein [Kitasatospora sp. GP82]MDH6130114.1 hypothetical protein [Kitasatospora sp. GP82]
MTVTTATTWFTALVLALLAAVGVLTRRRSLSRPVEPASANSPDAGDFTTTVPGDGGSARHEHHEADIHVDERRPRRQTVAWYRAALDSERRSTDLYRGLVAASTGERRSILLEWAPDSSSWAWVPPQPSSASDTRSEQGPSDQVHPALSSRDRSGTDLLTHPENRERTIS